MRPTVPDGDFVELFRELGPIELAKKLGISQPTIFRRRTHLENKYGISIEVPNANRARSIRRAEYPQRIYHEVKNGVVIVASDAHYWPGPASLMHKSLLRMCKDLKPKVIVLNGDVIDAPTVSRHPRIGWEQRPQLYDEIEAAKERLHEIELVTGNAHRAWNLGNHDARFETRLATVAPEYAMIHGVHLRDHFQLWEPAWSTWINDELVIKHRFKGGIHATFNNTVYAGKSIVTGHLHQAKITPFRDYNGRRYGVDTGCIADINGKQFVDYTEDNPLNWESAFGVFTFKDGRLMQPELVIKWSDTQIQWRGWVGVP